MWKNSNFLVLLPKKIALPWRPNLPNNSKSTRFIRVFIVHTWDIWLWIVPKCCGRYIWCVLQAAECWELRVWLLCDSFVGILGNFQAVEFVGSSTKEPVHPKLLLFLLRVGQIWLPDWFENLCKISVQNCMLTKFNGSSFFVKSQSAVLNFCHLTSFFFPITIL